MLELKKTEEQHKVSEKESNTINRKLKETAIIPRNEDKFLSKYFDPC